MIAAILATVIGAVIGFIGGWLFRGAVERPLQEAYAARYEEMKALAGQWERLAVDKISVIEKMRMDGFSVQRPAKISEAVDPEAEGLRRAEGEVILKKRQRDFMARAKADIRAKRPDISDREATVEALRLLREVEMEDPPG